MRRSENHASQGAFPQSVWQAEKGQSSPALRAALTTNTRSLPSPRVTHAPGCGGPSRSLGAGPTGGRAGARDHAGVAEAPHATPERAMTMALAPHHAAILAASDIAPEVITARGTGRPQPRSISPPGVQREPTAQARARRSIYNVRGELSTYMLRPDAPRIRDGKPAKYEFMRGFRMALDVPNLGNIRMQLDDPQVPLWITEGAKS